MPDDTAGDKLGQVIKDLKGLGQYNDDADDVLKDAGKDK